MAGSAPVSPTAGKAQYRLVVMGAAGVGKTCIITRFLFEEFVSEYKATVEELHRGEYEIAGMNLNLDILDTSGAFSFPAMRQLSISTGDAFILVYSVEDESSFEEVKSLRQQIINEKGGDEMTPIVIVANKADLAEEKRAVRRVFAESTVTIDWGNGYVEASAKEDTNISGIFREVLRQADIHIASGPSPAIRRRRESVSSMGRTKSVKNRKSGSSKIRKQDSCVIS